VSKKADKEPGAHSLVIVVRRRGHAGHPAHHGGAWKVAYADFVTAMMAFFLLLWLLGATTEDQRKGIADYFAARVPISPTSAGGEGVLEGGFMPRPDEQRFRLGDRNRDDVALAAGAPRGEEGDDAAAVAPALYAERIESQRFQTIQSEILRRIETSTALQELAGNLLFEITPEGLRIQIFDRAGTAMFPSGSATPNPHTVAILKIIGEIVGGVENGIVVTGHTDARPFIRRGAYGNWELSADRANAARRTLIANGVTSERFRRIEGRAALEPLIEDDPGAPRNRRIAITLLRTLEPSGATKPSASVQRLR
jgi:chemotaxis protein MotB